jgi:23S rRNA-/tRNA-specific pseudouridylate synthase
MATGRAYDELVRAVLSNCNCCIVSDGIYSANCRKNTPNLIAHVNKTNFTLPVYTGQFNGATMKHVKD